MIKALGKLSHEERSKICQLTTLAKRSSSRLSKFCWRGKAFCLSISKPQKVFLLEGFVSYCKRDCKLYRKALGNLKNNYFSTRVVSPWNKLDKDSIHANTADEFNINIDK